MKKILIAILITIVGTLVLLFIRFTHPEWQANLVSPGFNSLGSSTQKSEPEPSSSPNLKAPKTFNFDASTDLKAELEKVNPQVLDGDFQ